MSALRACRVSLLLAPRGTGSSYSLNLGRQRCSERVWLAQKAGRRRNYCLRLGELQTGQR